MTNHDQEDPAITRSFTFSGGAALLGVGIIIGGIFAVLIASMNNVNAIAGGWTAVGSGFLLMFIGGGAAHGHGMILRRAAQHHEVVMRELGQIRDVLTPITEMDRRRTTR